MRVWLAWVCAEHHVFKMIVVAAVVPAGLLSGSEAGPDEAASRQPSGDPPDISRRGVGAQGPSQGSRAFRMS